MDSLVTKLKANEAARRKIPIEDLVSIEYAAGYNAALHQMMRDLKTELHDAGNEIVELNDRINAHGACDDDFDEMCADYKRLE